MRARGWCWVVAVASCTRAYDVPRARARLRATSDRSDAARATLDRRQMLGASACALLATSSAAALPARAVPAQASTLASQPGAMQELISGFAGGAVQRIVKDIVLHPIDTVKVRLQASPSSRVLRRETFRDLYTGVIPPLLVGTPAGGIFFGLKDASTKALDNRGGMSRELVEAIAVTIANLPYWVVRTPAELIKVRRQAGLAPGGARAMIRDITEEAGIGGLWTGFAESFAYALPADIVKFVTYDRLKRNRKQATGRREISLLEKTVLGAMASATAQLATTPLDVIKTRVQTNEATNLVSAARQIAAEEGPAAFLAGVTPRLARSIVSGATQFGSYEFTKRLFPSSSS